MRSHSQDILLRMSIATLRPAATVVVLRETARREGFEVLLVRRNDKVAFMGGAYVFPGGRVDEADAADPGIDPFCVAGARELEEEAGVRISAADLMLFAHWVTPEIETRRYDTRFFLVRMPDGQDAVHDENETTALAWLTPAEAIDCATRGDIMLPPPTWTTLKQLSRWRSIGEVFAWAARTPVVRVQPNFVRDAHRTLLTLPGDPSHPAIDGWEVPEDTRFLLQEGRWRPVPP